jgi:mevalonate kinase
VIVASAPGKLILCGEHAVVYGRPAIAVPLDGVRAYAELVPAARDAGLQIAAPDLRRSWRVRGTPDDPLGALAQLGVPVPNATITLRSDLPVASGLGSGASIATALVRVLAAYAGVELAPAHIAALVYQSERHYHGTPSGIDNTVVAYARPVWYQRRARHTDAEVPSPTIELLRNEAALTFVIGDSGVRSPTRLPVGEVRRRWEAEPARHEQLFDSIADCVVAARGAIEQGRIGHLGQLLDANHQLLQQLGVSSPALDRMVAAARAAGALGAKLSGGGWGGVMLALVQPLASATVSAALREVGATRVLSTTLGGH